MGYNSHVLKCTLLVSVQLSAFSCFHKVIQPSPLPNFRVFSLLQKETLYPGTLSISHSLPAPGNH